MKDDKKRKKRKANKIIKEAKKERENEIEYQRKINKELGNNNYDLPF